MLLLGAPTLASRPEWPSEGVIRVLRSLPRDRMRESQFSFLFLLSASASLSDYFSNEVAR